MIIQFVFLALQSTAASHFPIPAPPPLPAGEIRYAQCLAVRSSRNPQYKNADSEVRKSVRKAAVEACATIRASALREIEERYHNDGRFPDKTKLRAAADKHLSSIESAFVELVPLKKTSDAQD